MHWREEYKSKKGINESKKEGEMLRYERHYSPLNFNWLFH
jgi:hypothetical protein